jgi:hypothetical protein
MGMVNRLIQLEPVRLISAQCGDIAAHKFESIFWQDFVNGTILGNTLKQFVSGVALPLCLRFVR